LLENIQYKRKGIVELQRRRYKNPILYNRNFVKGADLVNIQYEQLMPLVLPYQNAENAFRVILRFCYTEDGTVVHTSPTFGADDAKVAKEATEIPPMLF
jgi:isoleucyl-tRNA synthetase